MSVKAILKRIASVKAAVLKRANFDKKNVSDEVRGRLANDIYIRNQRNFRKVIGEQYDLVQDTDANVQAKLTVGGLNFLAKAKSAIGNLYTYTLIKTASLIAAVNAQQTITFSAVPDAGAWTITFSAQTTTSLAFGANATAVQSALNALSNLSGVTVTGSYTSGFLVAFAGADGSKPQPLMTISSNTLTASSIAVTTAVLNTTTGVAPVDTRSVEVFGNDIEVYSTSNATNTQVKAQLDASSEASSLISTSITSGQGSTAAVAVFGAEFKDGF